jgi:hypothetical protein
MRNGGGGGPIPTFVAEEREHVAEITSDIIAVQVYRELRSINDAAAASGRNIIGNCSNGSCDIIGNCSSSSKEEMMGRARGISVS